MIDLTIEEADAIRKARAEKAVESADLAALQAIRIRAKSGEERHQLERMIELRGGPAVATCKCGRPVTPESGGLHECSGCFERGYGK